MNSGSWHTETHLIVFKKSLLLLYAFILNVGRWKSFLINIRDNAVPNLPDEDPSERSKPVVEYS